MKLDQLLRGNVFWRGGGGVCRQCNQVQQLMDTMAEGKTLKRTLTEGATTRKGVKEQESVGWTRVNVGLAFNCW